MKQTKLFIALSAAVLSVAGFVATKASVKFAQFNSAHIKGITGTVNAAARFTSVKGASARTVWIATRASAGSTVLHTLVTATANNVQLYLK